MMDSRSMVEREGVDADSSQAAPVFVARWMQLPAFR